MEHVWIQKLRGFGMRVEAFQKTPAWIFFMGIACSLILVPTILVAMFAISLFLKGEGDLIAFVTLSINLAILYTCFKCILEMCVLVYERANIRARKEAEEQEIRRLLVQVLRQQLNRALPTNQIGVNRR